MTYIPKDAALLTVEEMATADELTIKNGTSGIELMRNAGSFCAEAIETFFEPTKTLILCGPGNNGGDGFVIAKKLEEAGWPVTVSLLVTPGKLSGDAKLAYEEWILAARSPVLAPFAVSSLEGHGLIVDAIFGAGLSKDVEGVVAEIIEAANAASLPVASVDVPTGIDGNTGAICGSAFSAELTTTFFCQKPGHLLLPGREHCGLTLVGDIGIKSELLDTIDPSTGENIPEAWEKHFPWPGVTDHKYARGHAIVVSGGTATTGAARLAARAALRVGSGLVTVASPSSALMVNASHLTSIMVRSFSDAESFEALVSDPRLNAFVIGPGNGVGEDTRARVLYLLSLKRSVVIDADALMSFEDNPEALFDALHEDCVLTPHEGEFARLFPDSDLNQRLSAARTAAAKSGAILVLKGPDTIIAHPDGRALITQNAPPTLATAGSGDVLAGFICGLQAQGMPAFEAAAAGVWLHGETASHFGLGLISEDLPEMLPDVLTELSERG